MSRDRPWIKRGQPDLKHLNCDLEAVAAIIDRLTATVDAKRFDTLVAVIKWAVEPDFWRGLKGDGDEC